MATKILTISGSLRAASSNSAVLEAVGLLAPSEIEIVRYAGLGSLPHFNPDLDTDAPPASVIELRQLVGVSDGIIFSSPEYAHGIAGSFKNGLDWLVRSLEFPGKPVALINAAPRASHAEAQTREILRTMSARLVDEAMLTLPVQGSGLDAHGIAATKTLAAPLSEMLQRFAAAIEGQAESP
ncbi:MAG TPA: NADPH-dependent FMN reductase [Devosiaceae bacterium]|nr:NADPH-dependent FMN reductase [Devosiaceae bacterium]